ncbi:MAG TPA: hypothetical protein VEV43_00285 [Actinomycetota bacterium]|nr:hypothetical protein [Actinomycetota bacterium]
MRSSKRVLGLAVAAAAVAGLTVLPSAAQAQSCTPVPLSTTGITIEGAGREVRVPSVSGVAVCYDVPSTTGIPWVETEPGGGFSVLITGSSGSDGSVSLRYTADGSSEEIEVPLPGSGGNGETCLVGVGFPARDDCAFKISPDNDPVPTLPPVSPPPVPTAPPVPPRPPLPTAPPVPTVPPIPDDVCGNPRTCLSDLPYIIDRAIAQVIARVYDILNDIVIVNCGPILQLLGLC